MTIKFDKFNPDHLMFIEKLRSKILQNVKKKIKKNKKIPRTDLLSRETSTYSFGLFVSEIELAHYSGFVALSTSANKHQSCPGSVIHTYVLSPRTR